MRNGEVSLTQTMLCLRKWCPDLECYKPEFLDSRFKTKTQDSRLKTFNFILFSAKFCFCSLEAAISSLSTLHTKVNVRTGPEGWFKRINKNFKSVARTAELNDGIEIDPSRDVVSKMYNAARDTVLARKAPGF